MSHKKFNSNAPLEVKFQGFGGIESKAHCDLTRSASIVNFRIRSDGALEKRCGTRYVFDLGNPIRGVWSGYLHGKYSIFFLAGNMVYRSDPPALTISALGRVSSSTGNANFFSLQGRLYLTDGGNGIYLIGENGPSPALGYVPLIGKDWDNDELGEIYEPYNLINHRARITYVVSDPPSVFLGVPKRISSVQALYLNGTLLDASQYKINNSLLAIEITGLRAGDRAELHVTFQENEDPLLPIFCSTKNSTFFSSGEKSRTFFWGSDGSDTMFCTSYVSPDSLTESQRHYPSSDPLYLPRGYEFRVGDGTYPIRGAIRHHDALLIFTEKDTWAANSDSTGLASLPTIPVNAELGCVSDYGAVLTPNDPITVSEHGLYRWQSRELEETRRNAVRVSAALDDLLNPNDFRNATLYYDPLRDELWLGLKHRSQAWVCSPARGDWYCFTGIQADRFFNYAGNVGYINGALVYMVDPTKFSDMNRYYVEKPINATYESASFDFGSDRMKNLSEVGMVCDPDGGELTVEFCPDEGQSVARTLKPTSDHSVFAKRLRSGRFRSAKLRITSNDPARPVIHSLKLQAH